MKIGVVGLGYVGLPLAVAFCDAGHDVAGVDTDARDVEALAAGRSHIEDVPDESLAAISSRLHVSNRYADLAKVGSGSSGRSATKARRSSTTTSSCPSCRGTGCGLSGPRTSRL